MARSGLTGGVKGGLKGAAVSVAAISGVSAAGGAILVGGAILAGEVTSWAVGVTYDKVTEGEIDITEVKEELTKKVSHGVVEIGFEHVKLPELTPNINSIDQQVLGDSIDAEIDKRIHRYYIEVSVDHSRDWLEGSRW